MASSAGARPVVKLRSTAGTGYTYVTRKNRRNDPDRMRLRKYDPVVRRHVELLESADGEAEHGGEERAAQGDRGPVGRSRLHRARHGSVHRPPADRVDGPRCSRSVKREREGPPEAPPGVAAARAVSRPTLRIACAGSQRLDCL